MTSHKDHRLDQLGIPSQDEADELERELDIRFDQFSYHDRKVWNQQNSYLDEYARTRTVSYAADTAGVTVSTAQAWKYLVTLGFTRRLEVADLRFSDRLQVMALERAREPDAPASLLIALLRAHIPEKYSANGHLLDTSKSDELLFHYRQDAQRELAAGHPTLRAIANGTYQPPHSLPKTQHTYDYDTATDESNTPNRHSREGGNPQMVRPNLSELDQEIASPYDSEESTPHSDHDGQDTTPEDASPRLDPDEFAHFNLSPAEGDTAHPHLSPTGGETQRGGSPSASLAPHEVNQHSGPDRHTGRGRYPEKTRPNSTSPTRAIASLHQKARRHPNNDHNTFKVTRF